MDKPLYFTHVFRRADSELVLDNIFRIFDPDETGSVRFNELLMAFSMSMRGSGNKQVTTGFKEHNFIS
jgi:hypothetical protein